MAPKGSMNLEVFITFAWVIIFFSIRMALISQHISELEWENPAENQKSSNRTVLKSLGFWLEIIIWSEGF